MAQVIVLLYVICHYVCYMSVLVTRICLFCYRFMCWCRSV